MSKKSFSTKHLHLLPLLSVLPLLAVLLVVTQLNLYLDPLIIATVAITYIAVNIIYRMLHGTLKIGYVVEYSLLALIAYFVLSQYS